MELIDQVILVHSGIYCSIFSEETYTQQISYLEISLIFLILQAWVFHNELIKNTEKGMEVDMDFLFTIHYSVILRARINLKNFTCTILIY